ncbi:MAG: putative rane-bound dehydrogenase domain protein [Bryobacterales bacterium]|nr:putative rane-bound dehydrogenase domain protein [Bryobacterales bacterium]
MKIETSLLVALAACLLIVAPGCSRKAPPFSPKEALKTFQIDPAWRIDLFASEPMFASPVAMEIDEDGRIYVVQDSGYPLNTEDAVGKIWLLEDTDGDGKPDKSTLFADKLVLPTGVMRWKKGILVTDAPNLWYMEDTDGDGKADIKRVVLTGFAFTNPQHTVNTPLYGLDNWIYLAHEGFANAVVFANKFGDKGSDIHFADHPASPVVKNERRNVRFRPDSYQLETTSSSSQFGLTFDDYGHTITVNNSNHAREEVLAARYLARNPDLLAGSTMQDVSDHGAAAQVYFIAKNPRFELLSGSGIFTSACGITWFQGGTLVAEPVHGLVHRDIWKPSGATFQAKRAKENVEFLASTDNWSRPVNFYNGPDGALYVIDYYRKIIEHPEWTSSQVAGSKDLYDGKDLGRIYRVTPAEGQTPPTPRLRLSQASDEELVGYLEKPNIWWRRTAQRLLVDRKSERAVEPLKQLAQSSKSPLGRLHALWTLEGLNKLDTALVQKALGDSEPGVRENAIILAESRLADPKLVDSLFNLEKDSDPRVRFQLLATLGFLKSPAAAQVRQRLLDRDMEDRWVQMAALSASSDQALPALEAAVASRAAATPGRTRYFQALGAMIGSRGKPVELAKVITTASTVNGKDSDWWRAAELDGLASGLRSRHRSLQPQPLLLKLYADDSPGVRRAALRLLEIFGLPSGIEPVLQRAAAVAVDAKQEPDRRANAISLLALAAVSRPEDFYEKFIDPREPEDVQIAAVHALGKEKGQESTKFLLARWRSMTPSIRLEAGNAVISDPDRFQLLLDAIDKGNVQPWSLPLRQRIQMQMNRDPALRERARALLSAKAGNRDEVVKRYQGTLDKASGDPSQGRATFEKICAKCHKMNGVGSEVGPDLATVRNRTPDALLTDILIPSRSIAQMYEAYAVELISGGMLEGVIGEQTSNTITLVHEQGKKDVISRSEIKQMYVSNLSAMPEDLDKEISPAQMADVIAYLKKPN